MWAATCFVVFAFCEVAFAASPMKPKCFSLCSNHHYCRTMNYVHERRQQVVLVTEGKSKHKEWPLDNITIILGNNMEEDDAIKLSCYAHEHSINYAFIAKVPEITNTSDPAFQSWAETTETMAINTYSDFVVLDFLTLINKCHQEKEHIEDVLGVVNKLHTRFSRSTKAPQRMICVMPWKPPCFGGNCSLAELMKDKCELFIINPESFISTCDDKCNARATVPMSSLVIGTDEYLSGGVEVNKLLMGIPWHGYDYTCAEYKLKKAIDGADICYVAKVTDENGQSRCDYNSSRTKITLPELMKRFPKTSAGGYTWNPLYHAPFYAYKETQTGNDTQHQIWFENLNSLFEKYRLAKDLDIGGVVIYTADDVAENDGVARSEFSWLIHKLFVSGTYQFKKGGLDYAGVAAGIGVGCLVLGAVLGFIVGCVVSKKRNKSSHRRLPFAKDEDVDGYHDDDATL